MKRLTSKHKYNQRGNGCSAPLPAAVSNTEVLTRRHRSRLRSDFRGGFPSQSAMQCSRRPAGLGGWVPGSGGQRRGPGCSRMGWQHDGSLPGTGCDTWETISEVQTVHNAEQRRNGRDPSKSVHLRISDSGREKGARVTSLLDLSDLIWNKTGRTTQYWVAVLYLWGTKSRKGRESKLTMFQFWQSHQTAVNSSAQQSRSHRLCSPSISRIL